MYNSRGIGTAIMSPSPRRAWIEIYSAGNSPFCGGSPSPRRAWIEMSGVIVSMPFSLRRPPHGGRGLKYNFCETLDINTIVALPTEGVD